MSGISTIAIIAIVALYLIPTWIALNRRTKHSIPIFFVNLFLGWTLIGWLTAFVWSCVSPPRLGRVASPSEGGLAVDPPTVAAEALEAAKPAVHGLLRTVYKFSFLPAGIVAIAPAVLILLSEMGAFSQNDEVGKGKQTPVPIREGRSISAKL